MVGSTIKPCNKTSYPFSATCFLDILCSYRPNSPTNTNPNHTRKGIKFPIPINKVEGISEKKLKKNIKRRCLNPANLLEN